MLVFTNKISGENKYFLSSSSCKIQIIFRLSPIIHKQNFQGKQIFSYPARHLLKNEKRKEKGNVQILAKKVYIFTYGSHKFFSCFLFVLPENSEIINFLVFDFQVEGDKRRKYNQANWSEVCEIWGKQRDRETDAIAVRDIIVNQGTANYTSIIYYIFQELFFNV